MLIAIKILGIIGTILTVMYAYRAVLFVLGFFTAKKYKPTENKHTYGICIAARNERADKKMACYDRQRNINIYQIRQTP